MIGEYCEVEALREQLIHSNLVPVFLDGIKHPSCEFVRFEFAVCLPFPLTRGCREASAFVVLQLMTPRAGDYDSHAMAVLRAGKLDEFAQNFLSILNASSNSNACKNVAGMISQLTSLCLTRKTTKVTHPGLASCSDSSADPR